MTVNPIGVITGGHDPCHAMREVGSLGLTCCQLSMPPREWSSPAKAAELLKTSEETGVKIVGCFCGFAGERYDDIPTVQRTVGLVPEATRAERLQITLENSDAIAAYNVPALLAHIGFVPEDRSSSDYKSIVIAVQQVCDRCARNNQNFGLETGQESGQALYDFIGDVGRPNLKVNFDPANMLMYGADRPLEAVKLVRPYLISIHCKDGRWPTEPGKLGHEVPFGEGEVNVPAFIGYLKETNFTGPYIIEREISGPEQKKDVLRARALIEGLL